MNEKDHKEYEGFDIDMQACSSMDCTGLIPALTQDEAERKAYEDLYPFITKAGTDQEDMIK